MRRRITLSLALLLVVAFGLHSQEVRDTTGLNTSLAASPAELLKGKVAGVRVSATDGGLNGIINTEIRGLNSLRANSEPLWIVDGAMIINNVWQNSEAFWQYGQQGYSTPSNQFAFIDVCDIESIQVLKDISQTAAYGIYGANGVVIVNTRMPRTKELQVNWNSGLEVSMPDHGFGHPSFSHGHNVSVGGVTNRNRYLVSLNLRDNNGIIPREGNTFGGLRINYDSKANKYFWYGLNSYISAGRQDLPTTTAWYGSPSMMMSYRGQGNMAVEDWIAGYDDQVNDYRTVNNAYFAINFLSQLQWETSLAFNFENNTRYIWYGDETEFGKANSGAASIMTSAMFNYNALSHLKYNQYLKGGHYLSADAGVELSGSLDKFNTMNGTNLFSHELRARGLSLAGSKARLHKANRQYGHLAVFGKVSYDYNRLAGLAVIMKAGNTSRYDDGKFTLYPAVNGYVDLARFINLKNDILSSLKIDGGWGLAGRETNVPYDMFDMFTPGGYVDVDSSISILYEGLNRLLSSEYNIGLNVGIFADRLTLGAKWYSRLTDDSFSVYCFGKMNETTGRWYYHDRSFVSTQLSTIRNRGLEFDVNAIPVVTDNIKWTLSADLAINSNQVVRLSENDMMLREVGSGLWSGMNAIGYGVSPIVGYVTDQYGEFVDQTGDGKIAREDMVVLAESQPDLFGGFATSLYLYGFTIDAGLDGSYGQHLLNMNRMMKDKAQKVSDLYVEDASFLRLSRIGVSYGFNTDRVKWLKGAKVGVSANNMAVLTCYSGLNPDIDSFGTTGFSKGVDYGSHPMVKSIVLNIQLKF